MTEIRIALKKVSPEQLFIGSVLFINAGNYIYNLLLGRLLGPELFADAALLVTLLLVLSFLGITFQLATAKFAVIFSGSAWDNFRNLVYKQAVVIGMIVAAMFIFFSKELQLVFRTETPYMFVVFGFGVPLYFLMGVNRGSYQGRLEFKNLSISHQTEMWSRLLLTLGLFLLIPQEPALVVALGIAFSFVFGLIPSNFKGLSFSRPILLTPENKKQVSRFIILTAFYEFTQIIINNSDVLMVKHYFDGIDAGLYASLALIGRVVYFVAWIFIMLLLPKVVQKQKDGEPTTPIFFKYVGYIALLSIGIVMVCYLIPGLIVTLMFGEAYLAMAGLLWQYTLATSLFAISNIFAYYFLSLDQYIPVVLSTILGFSQILLIVMFHQNLANVVHIQIVAMAILLVVQLVYFFIMKKNRL